MKLQLVKGKYSQSEALDLLTQLVHVKIRYHENKIDKSFSEEDIKMRETRIKEIQKAFYDAQKQIREMGEHFNIESVIQIESGNTSGSSRSKDRILLES